MEISKIISENIPFSISILSIIVAFTSVIYARKSREIAIKANEISIHQGLKPSRLAVYNALRDFTDYCSKYYTSQCIGTVEGTRDLKIRIGELKWYLDSQGPLGMQDVEAKAELFQKKAWQLQRVLDRQKGSDKKPLDKQYTDIEDNLYGLTDWFANENNDLKILFEKYLKIA